MVQTSTQISRCWPINQGSSNFCSSVCSWISYHCRFPRHCFSSGFSDRYRNITYWSSYLR
ncbi:unnamed protein product, partial [Cylicocyclus nassatus]